MFNSISYIYLNHVNQSQHDKVIHVKSCLTEGPFVSFTLDGPKINLFIMDRQLKIKSYKDAYFYRQIYF